MKRNLILGFCTGYRFELIESFVASVLASAPSAHLVLFTSGLDEQFYQAAARFGIGVEDAAPYLDIGMHPQNARYFAYQQFLRSKGHAYDRALLTDVRDVFLQGDPFALRHPKPVCFALEDTTILNEVVNEGWIRDLYGEEVLASIAPNYVSCSGTTLGTIPGIELYLGALCAEMELRSYDRMKVYDQGIHNFLVWVRRPNWGWVDRADTIVDTVGCTSPERIELIDDLVVIDGGISPVIHQWDRHAALRNHVAAASMFKLKR